LFFGHVNDCFKQRVRTNRIFRSRRENRPYFFNRATGDTMWEMPPIHHVASPDSAAAAGNNNQQQHQPQSSPHSTPPPPGLPQQQQQQHHQGFDRVSDPLGINGPPHPPGPSGPQHPPPPHHNGPQPLHPQQQGLLPGVAGAKRRPSEEMVGGPAAKRFIVTGPWDLEIPTNVILFEKKPSMLPHPHPEVEMLRSSYVMKLRQSFQEMCHSREGEIFSHF
jgi:phosphorylated CTD-interacting factor 1